MRILIVIGDTGGFNFTLPVYQELSIRGHFITCALNPKLNETISGRRSTVRECVELTEDLADTFFDPEGGSVKFDVVLVSDTRESNVEKHVILKAKEKGIPVYAVIDQWTYFKARYSDLIDGKIKNEFRYLPDKVLVVDELAKKRAVDAGIPEDIIVISGSPYLEHFINKHNERGSADDAGMIRRKFGISPDKKIILFASEPLSKYCPEHGSDYHGYNEKDVLKDVLLSLEDNPDHFFLLIRLHPFEDKHSFNAPESTTKVNYAFCSETPLVETITAADVVVGMKSMLLIEAALLGKKVISYQKMDKKDDEFIGNRIGASFPCYVIDELKRALADLPSYSEDLTDTLVKPHVNATDRIVKFLESSAGS